MVPETDPTVIELTIKDIRCTQFYHLRNQIAFCHPIGIKDYAYYGRKTNQGGNRNARKNGSNSPSSELKFLSQYGH